MGPKTVTPSIAPVTLSPGVQARPTRSPVRSSAQPPLRGRTTRTRPKPEVRRVWRRLWSQVEGNAMWLAAIGALLLVTMAVLGSPRSPGSLP